MYQSATDCVAYGTRLFSDWTFERPPKRRKFKKPDALLKGEKAEFESKLFLAEKAYQGATDCEAYGTDDERVSQRETQSRV